MNIEYLFPSIGKMDETIKDFGKILKNAAVRKVILAAYKISTYHKCLSALGDSSFSANWRCIKPRLQNAPPSTPSASDISRHDRSCLYFDFINQNLPFEPHFVGASSTYSLSFASCPDHNYRINLITIVNTKELKPTLILRRARKLINLT
ncbi:hypothetical protein V1477_015570 [Vespula maculifrons]|uniref:Uncharacterized protein n=1 Tax=Vespula maculifrons TaxID=7453 RepID=A0ABD2BEX9_VESMC